MPDTPTVQREKIQDFLDGSLLAVISWDGDGAPQSGLFLFGNDQRGRLFVRTLADAPLAAAVRERPALALVIYREAELLDGISGFALTGSGRVLEDADEIAAAYALLRKKSPLLGQTPEADGRDNYVVLAITVTEFRRTAYPEFSGGPTPLLLRRKGPDRTS